MNLSNRRLWLLGAIGITAIMIVTLVFAPANNKLNSGSTYNRAPDGYGAWYALMSKRGTEIQRWQKPVEDFAKNPDTKPPSTLLRIYSSLIPEVVSDTEENWVKQGNTLVILGVRAPVTPAPFSSFLPDSAGEIKIDTGRRNPSEKNQVLGDRFGAVVWQKTLGKGTVYFAAAPHLAANAYQDFPGNYEFLAKLVTRSQSGDKEIEGTEQAVVNDLRIKTTVMLSPEHSEGLRSIWPSKSSLQAVVNDLRIKTTVMLSPEHSEGLRSIWPSKRSFAVAQDDLISSQDDLISLKSASPILNKIWVDEYIHGYKDPEIIESESEENLFGYLAKTPLFPVAIQGTIMLIVAIFAGWKRFGQPVTLSAPQVDSSEAYIQALAGVLEKANSTDFAVEAIGKAERLQLQKALLLGETPLESQALIDAWVEQTGRKAAELEGLLRSPSRKQRISDRDLLAWLNKWEQIRQHLPSNRKDIKSVTQG